MKNSRIFRDETGNNIEIEILMGFKIEELDKEYIVYTVNDDESTPTVTILISQIIDDGDIPRIVSIPETEKELVVLLYNDLKASIN
jgi:Protein of unknown function (DUF1292).